MGGQSQCLLHGIDGLIHPARLAQRDAEIEMRGKEVGFELNRPAIRRDRLHAIAQDYLRSDARTLVVSPDNRSRVALNTAIHEARLKSGQVSAHERAVTVLIARNDVSGADRAWARLDCGVAVELVR